MPPRTGHRAAGHQEGGQGSFPAPTQPPNTGCRVVWGPASVSPRKEHQFRGHLCPQCWVPAVQTANKTRKKRYRAEVGRAWGPLPRHLSTPGRQEQPPWSSPKAPNSDGAARLLGVEVCGRQGSAGAHTPAFQFKGSQAPLLRRGPEPPEPRTHSPSHVTGGTHLSRNRADTSAPSRTLAEASSTPTQSSLKTGQCRWSP